MNKVLSFDTLKYANRLKQINVPPEQAELQAEVMKEVLESAFQTAELATKPDLNHAITLVRKDMEAMEQRLDAKIEAGYEKLDAKIDAGYARLDTRIDALYNKLIIRMTSIIVAAIGATGMIFALIQKFVH